MRVERRHLSLLAAIKEKRCSNTMGKKGNLTIKQLSYVYKPRKTE